MARMTGVLEWSDIGSLGRTGWEDEDRELPFYVREQLECMQLCLGREEEPAESLWVRMKERTGKGDRYSGCLF